MSLVQQIVLGPTPERILTGLLALMVIALGILCVRLARRGKHGAFRGEMEKQQDELRELSIALANAVEGVTRLDKKGRFTFVNRAYADSIGYEPEEIVGRDWRMTIQGKNHPHILLSNAIKFSPRGGLVTLRAVRQEGMLRFEVADEGRGIPADKLETIFDRFQQVDASDAREKGGTGLGLSISRSIVNQHGGRIWAEAQPGQGSTFSFTIPFAGERTDLLMERTEESKNAQTHSAH